MCCSFCLLISCCCLVVSCLFFLPERKERSALLRRRGGWSPVPAGRTSRMETNRGAAFWHLVLVTQAPSQEMDVRWPQPASLSLGSRRPAGPWSSTFPPGTGSTPDLSTTTTYPGTREAAGSRIRVSLPNKDHALSGSPSQGSAKSSFGRDSRKCLEMPASTRTGERGGVSPPVRDPSLAFIPCSV